jgi:hypothetical protein
MTKTIVNHGIAAIAICGTLVLASMSPVLAGDAIQLAPVYQVASKAKNSQPAVRPDAGMPKIKPDVVDPKATRWMPVISG